MLGDVVTGVETGVGYVAEIGSTWMGVRQSAATSAVQRAGEAETVADALESLSLSATDLEGRSRAAQRRRARLDAIAIQCRDLGQRIEATSGLLAQARDAARAAAPDPRPPAPCPTGRAWTPCWARPRRSPGSRRIGARHAEQIETDARSGQLGAEALRTVRDAEGKDDNYPLREVTKRHWMASEQNPFGLCGFRVQVGDQISIAVSALRRHCLNNFSTDRAQFCVVIHSNCRFSG